MKALTYLVIQVMDFELGGYNQPELLGVQHQCYSCLVGVSETIILLLHLVYEGCSLLVFYISGSYLG